MPSTVYADIILALYLTFPPSYTSLCGSCKICTYIVLNYPYNRFTIITAIPIVVGTMGHSPISRDKIIIA